MGSDGDPGAADGQQVSRFIGKDKTDSSNLNERSERIAEGHMYTRVKEKKIRSLQGHAPSDLLPLAWRHLQKKTEPLKIAPPAGTMSQHPSP